ncbi:MAG: nicotinate-nucleotide adenylyltransferase [Candidatus Accumulibacter sp.]|jgi:nicotinate-nucleotide adenylyltransferase|nr:nicotinate-nucleotide adenylyltransferase [Accumulibacter sp.]
MKRPEARDIRPLGLFGGTFDPIHFAHLRLAEAAYGELGLSGIRWIPAGKPVLRESPHADARQRLEMVRLAIADNPRFELDATEVEADRPSYTVPTIERLRQPDQCGAELPLVLLVGADAFSSLPSWHLWERLFKLAHIAVARRPGFPIEPETLPEHLSEVWRARFSADPDVLSHAPSGAIVSFPMTPLGISATRIRQLILSGLSTRYLLPDPVIAYIEERRFYRESSRAPR